MIAKFRAGRLKKVLARPRPALPNSAAPAGTALDARGSSDPRSAVAAPPMIHTRSSEARLRRPDCLSGAFVRLSRLLPTLFADESCPRRHPADSSQLSPQRGGLPADLLSHNQQPSVRSHARGARPRHRRRWTCRFGTCFSTRLVGYTRLV